jgi:hypothetical protein
MSRYKIGWAHSNDILKNIFNDQYDGEYFDDIFESDTKYSPKRYLDFCLRGFRERTPVCSRFKYFLTDVHVGYVDILHDFFLRLKSIKVFINREKPMKYSKTEKSGFKFYSHGDRDVYEFGNGDQLLTTFLVEYPPHFSALGQNVSFYILATILRQTSYQDVRNITRKNKVSLHEIHTMEEFLLWFYSIAKNLSYGHAISSYPITVDDLLLLDNAIYCDKVFSHLTWTRQTEFFKRR